MYWCGRGDSGRVLLSLRIRRRRLWVRRHPSRWPTQVRNVRLSSWATGARTDAGVFTDEFGKIAARLRDPAHRASED